MKKNKFTENILNITKTVLKKPSSNMKKEKPMAMPNFIMTAGKSRLKASTRKAKKKVDGNITVKTEMR